MTGEAAPDVRVLPDHASVSAAAADFIAARARQEAQRGPFPIVLSGGSTPAELYRLLALPPFRDSLPWDSIHLFWADERCVPPDMPGSNYKVAFDAFISRAPVPDANVHRIRAEQGADSAAAAYEEELLEFFGRGTLPRFGLALLGAGEDGHTASLFPGSPVVGEKKRLAAPVVRPAPGPDRVTLTLQVLNNAAMVLFLVTGQAKARIAREILENGNPGGHPAGLVRPVRGDLVWMLDRAAASAMTGRSQRGE